MKPENSPIIDLEAKKFRARDTSAQELLIREKDELSHPIEPQSLEQLRAKYPQGEIQKGQFIVANDQEKLIFDKKGREIEHTTFRKLNPYMPSEFDVQSRIRATYDDEGYLESITSMSVPKIGWKNFTKKYVYEKKESGKRELQHIVYQEIDKQGIIEPGLPVGDPEIIDFSDID